MVETKQKEKIASSEKLRDMASKYESKGDLAKAEALKNIGLVLRMSTFAATY